MRTHLCVLGCALLAACSSPSVNARTFYTSRKDLASYVLDTPDPDKVALGLGQLVWVEWTCPELRGDTGISAVLRFRDGFEQTSSYPVTERRGSLMIDIPAAQNKEHHGLLSYRIELRHGKEAVASTQHKLWVRTIEVKDT